jgi:hypothetical protein
MPFLCFMHYFHPLNLCSFPAHLLLSQFQNSFKILFQIFLISYSLSLCTDLSSIPHFSFISIHKGRYLPFLLNTPRKPFVHSGNLYSCNSFLELYSSKTCYFGMACCKLMGIKNYITPKASDFIAN